MIEESVIKAVVERTDIVRLISEYVQLKKRGGTLVGLCPFHHEKTPSFHVSAERGRFHCFGCGKNGDAISFLMEHEGLRYPEAIERLAERVGIEIVHTSREPDKTRQEARSKEKALFEVMRSAQAFFAAQYTMTSGIACREYAERRGITSEMVSAFGLGFAPDSWDAIVDALKQGRHSLEDAKEAGLVGKRDSGGYYARFRNRLIFPVYSVRGDVVAFSGRALDNNEAAKYYNSPVTAIYTKGDHLFGLYQAKRHITREHCAIMVEGNADVVMMHAYGFCHTVASLGTALTPNQALLLSRHTKRVYLMYDNDEAGLKAMCHALSILMGYEFEGLYAVELPKGDDPDSYLRTYGAEGMTELLANAKPLGMWCVQKKCADVLKQKPELRKRAYAELSDLITSFPDKFAQRHYLDEAARSLGHNVKQLAIELGIHLEGLMSRPVAEAKAVQEPDVAHLDPVEWDMAHLILQNSERFDSFMAEADLELFEEPALRNLLQEYAQVPDRTSSWSIEKSLSENSLKLYDKVICSVLDVPESDHDDWYAGALAELTRKWAAREQLQVSYQIAEAVEHNDTTGLNDLLKRNADLIELMKQTQKDRKFQWQKLTTAHG